MNIQQAYKLQCRAFRVARRQGYRVSHTQMHCNAQHIGKYKAQKVFNAAARSTLPRRIFPPEVGKSQIILLGLAAMETPVAFAGISLDTIQKMQRLARKHQTKFYLSDRLGREAIRRHRVLAYYELKSDELEDFAASLPRKQKCDCCNGVGCTDYRTRHEADCDACRGAGSIPNEDARIAMERVAYYQAAQQKVTQVGVA